MVHESLGWSWSSCCEVFGVELVLDFPVESRVVRHLAVT